MWYAKPMAPEGVKCWNPAFDVTDHSLITAIITEKGVLYPPFDVSLKAHFGKEETHDSLL
jgi:methylthioribose-1-phosphate isomerase